MSGEGDSENRGLKDKFNSDLQRKHFWLNIRVIMYLLCKRGKSKQLYQEIRKALVNYYKGKKI